MNTLTLTDKMNLLGAVALSPDTPPSPKVKAWIAPVSYDENGNPVIRHDEKLVDSDIYQLLATAGGMLSNNDELAFYTAGWAAPTDENDDETVAPSQHPERRRVAMLCLVGKNGDFGSALRFYGDPTNTELMVQNDGQGALRDSALAIWDN